MHGAGRFNSVQHIFYLDSGFSVILKIALHGTTASDKRFNHVECTDRLYLKHQLYLNIEVI